MVFITATFPVTPKIVSQEVEQDGWSELGDHHTQPVPALPSWDMSMTGTGMAYEIKEEGRNGSVEIDGNTIVRRFTRTVGKDDIQQIPLSGVTGVEVDNRPMRSDMLNLHVNQQTYTWKMPEAQAFADEVMAALG